MLELEKIFVENKVGENPIVEVKLFLKSIVEQCEDTKELSFCIEKQYDVWTIIKAIGRCWINEGEDPEIHITNMEVYVDGTKKADNLHFRFNRMS